MPADPAAVKAIFLEAAAIDDPVARAALLNERCREDAALLARVNALLVANDRAVANKGVASFGDADGSWAVEPTADYPGGSERVGATLAGKYKLIEEIGEGGMGSVYMARQTEPVKRVVAVKVIKAGMDSKAVLVRFEAERQALAMMDHPNIAKVLDAGTTDGGRPFFVMELVKGTPITKFCDERRLTPWQRLELFAPVCQAIQHAHQKGVIHRDIKPSNVLVALYDDRPVPKVIDFGVAKAAGQTLTDKTLMTGFGAVVGTPEYMSPEQANLNNLDIDTRSDVYSLGVLLYELLTGSTPVDRKSPGKAALLEILRIVREVEAPRPSARLSTIDNLPGVAANRGTEPAKLSKLMKGELDWVVMKALEKDRARRYDTANALNRDIQRYLADEVVEARPPSTGYRLKKFVRRHKGQVLAASLVLFALLAGMAGTTWGLIEARTQRDEAETARGLEAEQRRKVEEREELLKEQKSQLETQTKKLEEQQKETEAARTEADLALHDNQRVMLREAWEAEDTPKLRAVLDQMRPKPGKPDLRGFETHYLDRVAHSETDAFTFQVPPGMPVRAGSTRIQHTVKLATNGYYGTVEALDLATGKPAVGFEPIKFRRSTAQEGPHLYVIPGQPPRLFFVDETKTDPTRGGTRPPVIDLRVWDARTGRAIAHCERLYPDQQLVEQGWWHRSLVWDSIGEASDGETTRAITQLIRDVKSDAGIVTGFESRAQVHDLRTGRAVLCLDPQPGIIERARLSWDDRYVVTSHRLATFAPAGVGQQPADLAPKVYRFTVCEAATGKLLWLQDMADEWIGFTSDGTAALFGSLGAARPKHKLALATGRSVPVESGDLGNYGYRSPERFVARGKLPGGWGRLEVRDTRTGLTLDTFACDNATIWNEHWLDDRNAICMVAYRAAATSAQYTVTSYQPSRGELIAYPGGMKRGWTLVFTGQNGAAPLMVDMALDVLSENWSHIEAGEVPGGQVKRIPILPRLKAEHAKVVIKLIQREVRGRTAAVAFSWEDAAEQSSKGNLLAAYDLESATERILYSLPLQQNRIPFDLSPDGSRVALIDHIKQELKCFDSGSGRELWAYPLPPDWNVSPPVFFPDGARLLVVDLKTGKVLALETSTGRLAGQTESGIPFLPEPGISGDIESRITPDGRAVVCAAGGTVWVIDTAEWKLRHRLANHKELARSLNEPPFFLDNRFVLVKVPGNVMEVWDLGSGQLASRFEMDTGKYTSTINHCLFSRNGSRAFLLLRVPKTTLQLAPYLHWV